MTASNVGGSMVLYYAKTYQAGYRYYKNRMAKKP